MEPQANYVATGAFVLIVLVALAAAILWLGGATFNTQYQVFETRVAGSVGGLDTGASARLNGIEVGRVADIRQDPADPQKVIVLLQIRHDATIRADSAASLEMTGLTGERYVEISGGTLNSPPLTALPGQRYPTIAWRPSSLDALFDDAPQLMQHLNVVADRLQEVLDDRNRAAISGTLAHMNHLAAALDNRAPDLARLLADGDATLRNLTLASARLDDLLAHLHDTPGQVDRLVASANVTLARAAKLANDLDNVVQTSRPGLHELTTTVPSHLDALLTNANRLTVTLDRLSSELEQNPSSVLFGAHQGGYRP